MKFKVPIRRKKNRSTATEEDVAAALAEPAPEPAAEEATPAEPAADTPADADTTPATEPEQSEAPATEETAAEETPAEETPAEETPAEETPTEETSAEETPAEETTEEEPVEETPQEVEQPEDEIAPQEEETFADAEQDPPTQDEAPTPTALEPDEITDNGTIDSNQFNEDSTDSGVSVELAPVPPMFGILKKGPYMVANATPKMMKTLKKQKWSTQFCRIDPSLLQIFCCDKDRGKLYESFAPVETDGKCMFFHINTYTTVQEGIEEDAKAKEFSFKITGLNGGPENTLTMTTSSVEEREKWVKVIKRTVTRMHIDQDRVGEHTKLRQMLTAQEAEISILEEELEKMAVVAGECAGRASLAEEKLSLKTAEAEDVEGKLGLATLEITSLRSQIAIMEERTRNLNILADDVNGVTAEEVEAAREQMQSQRTARLKAIQLEIGADEDYLEKYKKYLNLKRDSILQKHGSQFSINSMGVGQPKVSPSTVTAPMTLTN